MNSVKIKAAPADRVAHRIRTRTATVGVVGLGYVGLPLAEALALAGYSVTGYDTDPRKIDALRRGDSYIRHIDSVRVQNLVESGKFQATAHPDEFAGTDVVIICVPTPLTDAREPDLSCVVATGKMLARRLRPGQLVILESTTYPGTTDELLRPVLEQSGLVAGKDFFLAFSPEREDPGNENYNTRTIPKVVGGIDDRSRDLAADLYSAVIDDVVPVSDARVAEACKILENTYRAVNIALVNELKVVFDAMNIDIWEVIRAAKTKPFGFQPFYPGPGLGGHCIPIDPFYLTWAARRVGVNTKFIELAGEVNTQMPQYVVRRTSVALNGHGKPVKGASIAVLGVAYKKDVDDPRESPAFAIIDALEDLGAEVSYHDPYVATLPMSRAGVRLTSQPLTRDYLEAQDCVIIVTDHAAVDYRQVVRHSRLVVDTRNATAGISDDGCQIVKA